MFESVLTTIDRYNMLSPHDRIVVGVSGGPDSMALLHFLFTLSEKYSLYIHVAHLNHMLRGEEADEDTRYVEEYCRKIGVPCTIKFVDINKMSEMYKISTEDAGRRVRYEMFSSVAKATGSNKIALAHNMNDQAETVLMRIMRGTGLDGLCGIKPVRDGIYIRPLINTARSEIEEYCQIHDLKPRIDSTNLKPMYLRNRIRLELIPYIKENFNSNIESAISTMVGLINEDNNFIESYVEDIYKDLSSKEDEDVLIDINKLNMLHNSIKRRVIRKAIGEVKGNLTEIENKHIDLILSIAENGSTGAAVEMPSRVRASVRYNLLNINKYKGENKYEFSYELKIPGSTVINEIEGEMISEVIDNNFFDYKSTGEFIKYFDYDKIRGNLIIRCRKPGDYITPLGMKGKKKIKEFFIDSKIPRDRRDKIPLISIGSEILWIVGFIINDNYKISGETKRVLKLEFKISGGIKC